MGLRWGVVVPTGPLGEHRGRSGHDAWERARSFAVAAEDLGYDHLWVGDHLETVPPGGDAPLFESFCTLAALSQVTERIRLGQNVVCASFRSAGLLAKQGACIDVMSAGRYTFGIGAGWFAAEYEAQGIAFPAAGSRVVAMEEVLETVLRLWSEEEVSVTGAVVSLKRAHCSPKPTVRPPVWLGTHGRERGLRVAARLADCVSFTHGPDGCRELSGVLRSHCDSVGRDDASIARSVTLLAAVADSDAELEAMLSGSPYEHIDRAQLRRDHLVGSVEHVLEQIERFVAADVSEFVIAFPDSPWGDEGLQRFMSDVASTAGRRVSV